MAVGGVRTGGGGGNKNSKLLWIIFNKLVVLFFLKFTLIPQFPQKFHMQILFHQQFLYNLIMLVL